jgi:hypothetical protein
MVRRFSEAILLTAWRIAVMFADETIDSIGIQSDGTASPTDPTPVLSNPFREHRERALWCAIAAVIVMSAVISGWYLLIR